jgi:predicted nicotinamide N-methyase
MVENTQLTQAELLHSIITQVSNLDIKTSLDYEIDQCGTGGKIWKSSVILSKYLIKNKNVINDKYVLEIGAGTGVCGLVCATLNAKKVYLSDRDPGVLKLLDYNIEVNKEKINSSVEVVSLDWINKDDYLKIENVDLIVGSDLLYSSSMVKGLVDVLCGLARSETKVLIAIQRRSEEYDMFIKEISNVFELNVIEEELPDGFYNIVILELIKKL